MIVQTRQGLAYYQFEHFQGTSLFHGIYTRLGGVSSPPWQSLNVGGTVGDRPDAVEENLRRLIRSTGFPPGNLAQVRQIHSSRAVLADRPMDVVEQGDAMVSDRPGLLLLMRFADCVPILYFDPDHKAIGIAHAGWQGTLKGIAASAARKMMEQFGTSPGRLLVGIGPSIGPDHYLIGPDVISQVEAAFPTQLDAVLIRDGDQTRFDLWEANRLLLEKQGVTQVTVAGICTGCNLDAWYSHRAEQGKTGRFAAVIGLREDGI